MMVYQLPDANGLEVAGEVFATLERLKERFPADVDYVISLDTTRPIEAGIREIVITLFQAVALVIFVVYIFLQNVRSTLIPTLAVPVSLIGTFAVFPLLGFSINTLSLLGLVLAIGIVVDDAIVVVEAVAQKMEKGMGAKEATIEAMREVSAPIVATSLSLIAVFVPVATMGGITGSLYQQFAITIAISVAISSVNALTLSPALSALVAEAAGRVEKRVPEVLRRLQSVVRNRDREVHGVHGLFHAQARACRGAARRSYRRARAAVPGRARRLRTRGRPGLHHGGAATAGCGIAAAHRTWSWPASRKCSPSSTRSRRYTTVIAGFSMLTGTTQPNAGFIFLQLKEWDERPDIRDHAEHPHASPELRVRIARSRRRRFAFGPPAIPGLGTGSGFTMMLQDRSGSSPDPTSRSRPRTSSRPRSNAPRSPASAPCIVPACRRCPSTSTQAQALKMGVSLSDINTSIGAFLGGAYVNDFNRFGRLVQGVRAGGARVPRTRGRHSHVPCA